jgi:hypothetical protein
VLTLNEHRIVGRPHNSSRATSASRAGSLSSFSFLAANSATASRPRLPSPLRSVDNREFNGEEKGIESAIWDPETRTLRKSVREINMGEEMRPRQRRSQSIEAMTDGTPIGPTTSLVKLFEQQSLTGGMKPEVQPKPSMCKRKPPLIISPKPKRNISLQSVSPELERPALKPLPKRSSTTITTAPEKAIDAENKATPIRSLTASISNKKSISSDTPALPPPRRPRIKNPDYKDIASASIGGTPQPKPKIPASQQLQPPTASPLRRDVSPNLKRPSPGPYKDTYIKDISPHITGDGLANAMVGATIALKTSPPRENRMTKTPPQLPASRRNKNHDHHLGGVFHRSRSLSPQKKPTGMLQTLRKDVTGEEKEGVKKHKFRHPNKHNEATRSRWQDRVSDEDLKRYDGVWASNKGIFIKDPRASDEVCGLVVREIWSRSGLPPQRLAKIWDLVVEGPGGENGRGKGTLTRDQFVVGMYFIDMVLKGRNLPQTVSQSVWDSVRGVGLSVAIKKK